MQSVPGCIECTEIKIPCRAPVASSALNRSDITTGAVQRRLLGGECPPYGARANQPRSTKKCKTITGKMRGSEMIVLRLLPLFIVAAVLTSCAGYTPLPQVQRSESTNNAHASIGTELQPNVQNPKRKHALAKSKPRPAATVSASAA